MDAVGNQQLMQMFTHAWHIHQWCSCMLEDRSNMLCCSSSSNHTVRRVMPIKVNWSEGPGLASAATGSVIRDHQRLIMAALLMNVAEA